MRISVDGDHHEPLYRRIVDEIKHQIAVGKLQRGEQLPTVRGLAQQLKVDRNTVVRAYRILDRDGVISLQHGRGTFVRSHPQHPQLARHREERLRVLVSEAIAKGLALGYSTEEIEQAFSKNMKEWRRARSNVHQKRNGASR